MAISPPPAPQRSGGGGPGGEQEAPHRPRRPRPGPGPEELWAEPGPIAASIGLSLPQGPRGQRGTGGPSGWHPGLGDTSSRHTPSPDATLRQLCL